MASACVIESGTWGGNRASMVLRCLVGKHQSARLVAKKVTSFGRRQKNAGNQRSRRWRNSSNGPSVSRLRAFYRTFCHPRHQGAEARADLLDRMPFPLFEQGVVLFVAGLVLVNPAFG